MPFSLIDRRGNVHELPSIAGELVSIALIRNGVPPTSVVVLRDDTTVVGDDEVIEPGSNFQARLIEGYDISSIRQRAAISAPDGCSYLHRRLRLAATGALRMEDRHLHVGEVPAMVESVVTDTLAEFSLVNSGQRVVLGLSGGVDSSSLLMILDAIRRVSHGKNSIAFDLVAATFEDFDSRYSDTFTAAAELALHCGIEHHVLESGMAEKVFNLKRPIAQILMLLMETDDAHQAMYVDHHTTRRLLEVFADSVGSSTISLGLHTTDLLAGFLNAATSGLDMGGIPKRAVGSYRYIFPLAFVPKRELQLYYTAKTGRIPKQTIPNQWEFNPADRNFYYYLADLLQWYWPGIETWMFTGHARRFNSQQRPLFKTCGNCGASIMIQREASSHTGLCDVCVLLDRYGWLST